MNPKNVGFNLRLRPQSRHTRARSEQQISSLLYSLGLHGAIVLKHLNPSVIGVRDIDSIVLVDE